MFQTLSGNKKGISLIEVLVSVAIISSVLVSVLGLTSFSLRINSLTNNTTEANILAEEVLERIRNFRDNTYWKTDGLGKVATNTDYYIEKAGSPSQWQTVAGIETIGAFNRKFALTDVQRDGNSNIVASGGTVDFDTKKVTVTVFWQERGIDHQITLVSYFTNWRQ